MLWSYVLTTLGLAALYFIGGKRKVGWWIGISAQVLWVIYAVQTEQYGFIVSALGYGVLYIRGLSNHKSKDKHTHQWVPVRHTGAGWTILRCATCSAEELG